MGNYKKPMKHVLSLLLLTALAFGFFATSAAAAGSTPAREQEAQALAAMVTSTKDGTRLVTGTTPYSWLIQRQSGYTYTIRPAEKQSLMVNASGESNKNGTAIIV